MPEKKNLKILFLPTWYPSDQNPVLGIFIKEYAWAVSLYNEVIVLYSQAEGRDIRRAGDIVSDRYEDGIRTIRTKYKKTLIPKISYLFYIRSIRRAFKTLLRKGWRPDIIHAHVYLAGGPAVILGAKYKIPVVISEHWSVFPRQALKKINLLVARYIMNKAKVILAVSRNLGNCLQSYGIKRSFEVVPNTVDTKIFYPNPRPKDNDKKNILFAGAMKPIKGIPFLLQALVKLKQERQDFLLHILGGGECQEEYELLSKESGLGRLVEFHGVKNKQEVAEYMRRADFFILPSLWENSPCVLIEAMASGLTIIASAVGGIPEIINQDIGILVPAQHVDKLAQALNYMLAHYRDYSSDKISQYAKDNFSYEIIGRELDNIYRNLVS